MKTINQKTVLTSMGELSKIRSTVPVFKPFYTPFTHKLQIRNNRRFSNSVK